MLVNGIVIDTKKRYHILVVNFLPHTNIIISFNGLGASVSNHDDISDK